MGLIKALTTSTSSALGDQFKEFVNMPRVDGNTLIVRGVVEHGPANTNPSEGVISNGSKIVVPQGWAMMLVDNGKVEFSAEPGEYIYDNGSESSIFYGGFGQGLLNTFKTIGGRFTFAGETARDQRVYYINLLQHTGSKFGSTSPKEVYDYTYGMTIQMTFRGNFSYKVDNPLALITSTIGANPRDKITFDEVFDEQFSSDVNEQIYKALTRLMEEKKIRFSSVGAYTSELSSILNTILNEKWLNYGVLITSVSMEDISATDEYVNIIKEVESKALDTRVQGMAEADAKKAMVGVYSDDMSAAMAMDTGEAMKNAASNDKGTLMGFAGFNMAQQQGNSIMGTVLGNQQLAAAPVNPTAPVAAATADAGVQNAGPKFCPNCGNPTNGSNFCSNCGNKLI